MENRFSTCSRTLKSSVTSLQSSGQHLLLDMAQVRILICFAMVAFADSRSIDVMSAPIKVVITGPKPPPCPPLEQNFRDAGENLDINKSISHQVNNNLDTNSHPEVITWPRVFALNRDPSYPVVCYSGVSVNISNSSGNEASQQEKQINQSNSKERPPRIFLLSIDPRFPVLCREGYIPANLTDDGTTTEEDVSGDVTNVTCIRRDYEQNISAIFLHKTGPIQTAWNVFNSSISYGFFNVDNMDNIGFIKIMHEAIVDCEDYDFTLDDKGLSAGAAASLAG